MFGQGVRRQRGDFLSSFGEKLPRRNQPHELKNRRGLHLNDEQVLEKIHQYYFPR